MNISWHSIDTSFVKQMRFEKKELFLYQLQQGDLLVCEGGEAGRCAVWEEKKEMYFQNALHRIRFKGGINPYYFLYLFTYLYQSERLDDYIKGVTIKHLTKTALYSIPLLLPPREEQYRIVESINTLFCMLNKIVAEL